MKNKNQVPATIMLAVGAVFSAAGVFLLINRFTPMWSFSHKYMTDNAIFVMLAILGLFIGVISLLFALSIFNLGAAIYNLIIAFTFPSLINGIAGAINLAVEIPLMIGLLKLTAKRDKLKKDQKIFE